MADEKITGAGITPFTFPESLPQHECEWLTNAEAKQKLYARCCGVRISTDRKGQPVAHIALRVEDDQPVLNAVTNQPQSYNGTTAITVRYLTGGALENTMGVLRILGFDVTKARTSYAQDPQALAMVQQLKAKGHNDDKIDEALSMLALQRGDIAACGLGSKVVRIDSKDDSFTTSKGETIVTRKVNWIEAIPAPVTADAVLQLADLLGGAMRPTKAAAKSTQASSKGATSAPPKAAAAAKDECDF